MSQTVVLDMTERLEDLFTDITGVERDISLGARRHRYGVLIHRLQQYPTKLSRIDSEKIVGYMERKLWDTQRPIIVAGCMLRLWW